MTNGDIFFLDTLQNSGIEINRELKTPIDNLSFFILNIT